MAENVQNSFRISTDVDNDFERWEANVQNSFRISTDVDNREQRNRVCPKLISNFYWCRFWLVDEDRSVQNSFRISTDVDEYSDQPTFLSKTHFEFLLM